MRARDNPFAVSRVLAVRYRLRGATWEDLLERLERLGGRAAIVGFHGTGKTTLLEDLEPRLVERGYRIHWIRLSVSQPLPAPSWRGEYVNRLTKRDCVLLDGAEQLNRWAWWRFRSQTRRAGRVVITSHRPGLFPTLYHCTTDAELLAEIMEMLMDDTNRSSPSPDAQELFARNQGNIRDALRQLYDHWSTAPSVPGIGG